VTRNDADPKSAQSKTDMEMPKNNSAALEAHDAREQATTQSLNSSLATSGFLRLRQVLQLVPIGRSTLYQKMKLGTFPRAVKLGPRITAWRAADINEYLQEPR
jgi:prophage regulatory protein